MLQYNEREKSDPDIFKYTIKCGSVMLIFMMLIGVLYTLSTSLTSGYETVTHSITQGLSYLGILISKAEQIVNKTAVLYSMWASLSLVVWSLCVMLKIKKDCQKTKIIWKRVNKTFLLLSTLLTFLTVYMLFGESSLFLIKVIITCWIFIIVINGLSYIGDESEYRRFHKLEN